jgi:hypothetical protein
MNSQQKHCRPFLLQKTYKDLNIDDIIKSINIKSSNPLEFEICESMITEILSLEPVELIELVSNDCTIICSHNQQILMNRIDHIVPMSVRINDICDKTTIYTFDINEDKPVLISACDNGVYYDTKKYEELMNDGSVDVIIWSFSNNPTSKLYPHMYAWLHVDENNYIKDVSIKKAFTEHPNKYCIIGTMLFKKGKYFMEGLNDIYKNNNRTNGEFYVDNMIMPLINMGYKVKIFNVDNYLCWGTPNDYKTYNYWKEYFV